MLHVEQLRQEIIIPACTIIGALSDAAIELLVLTCAVESEGGTYIKQIEGPALGIFQMEPATHEDIWNIVMPARPGCAYKILNALGLFYRPKAEFVEYHCLYAAIMCRLQYARVKEALPAPDDLPALASYWNRYYNKNDAKGTDAQAVAAYQRMVKAKRK